MRRESGSPIPLNVKAPPLGERHDSSIPTLAGRKASMSYRIKPIENDVSLQEFRYDSHYIPGGNINIVSPLLSMKYNLSKDKIKL